LETNQTKRRDQQPRRARTQRAFLKPRSTSPSSVYTTPDLFVSLPVSERSFSASEFAHQCVNLERSIERNLGRLSGMGKPVILVRHHSHSMNVRQEVARCPRSIPRSVRRSIRATSDESSGHLPGNSRAVSEQSPEKISYNAGECPRSGWCNSQEASGQLPLKSAQQFTLRTQYRPRHLQCNVPATLG